MEEPQEVTIHSTPIVEVPAPSAPPLRPQQHNANLWDRFVAALQTKDMVFEDLSAQSNWPGILSELGFTELESGALLHLIEERASKASSLVLLSRKIGLVLEMLLLSKESRIFWATLAVFSGIILIVGGTVGLNTAQSKWTEYIIDVTQMALAQGWFISFVAGAASMFTLYGTSIGARFVYYKNKYVFDWVCTIFGVYVIFFSRTSHVLHSDAFAGMHPMVALLMGLSQAFVTYSYFFCYMFGLFVAEIISDFIERAAYHGRVISNQQQDQWWVREPRAVQAMRYSLLVAGLVIVGFGFGYPTAYIQIISWLSVFFGIGGVFMVALTDVQVQSSPEPSPVVCAEPRVLLGKELFAAAGQSFVLLILGIWGAAVSDPGLQSVFTWLIGFSLSRPFGAVVYRLLLIRQEARARGSLHSTWEDHFITVIDFAQLFVGLAGTTAGKPGWTFVFGSGCGFLLGSCLEKILGILSAKQPAFVPMPRYASLKKELFPEVMQKVQPALEVVAFLVVPIILTIVFASSATYSEGPGKYSIVLALQAPLMMVTGPALVFGHRRFLSPARRPAAAHDDSQPSMTVLANPLLQEAPSYESMSPGEVTSSVARSTLLLTSVLDIAVWCHMLSTIAQALYLTYYGSAVFLTIVYFLLLGVLAACARITYKELELKQEVDLLTGATKLAQSTALNFWFGSVFATLLCVYLQSPSSSSSPIPLP